MRLDEYICYIKNDKVNSLGMELNSELINKQYQGGGRIKSFLRKNLGVPLSLFLINNKKNIFDDFLTENEEIDKKAKTKDKAICIPGELFNKLINLRANPILKKKKTKRKKLKRKRKKTKKILSLF
jgi:hypothetical protein